MLWRLSHFFENLNIKNFFEKQRFVWVGFQADQSVTNELLMWKTCISEGTNKMCELEKNWNKTIEYTAQMIFACFEQFVMEIVICQFLIVWLETLC